jgi:hypothetical protein
MNIREPFGWRVFQRWCLIALLLMMPPVMLAPACGLNLDGGTGGVDGSGGTGGGSGGGGGAGSGGMAGFGPSGSGGSGDLCTDTCPYNHDTFCDDGGPLSLTGNCAYGSDCADCGIRSP